MAGWSGSGVFSVTHNWQQDQVNGLAISSTRMDAQFTDVVNGVNNCVTKDGQNVATANLPMGNFRHTGVSAGTASDNYATVGQLQGGGLLYAIAGGSANAYTLSISPAIAAYAAGQRFIFNANHLSTGSVTLDVNSLGAKAIKIEGLFDLPPYAIKDTQLVEVVYDGTQFQIVNLAPVTGDIQMWSSTTVKPGWLVLDGTTTIGNASSGADFASDAYEGLFKHIYASTDDAEAAVSSGRVDVDSDWTNNKTITLPDTADMSPYGVGSTLTKGFKTDGSETSTPLGSITGSVSGHALTISEMPAHSHDAQVGDVDNPPEPLDTMAAGNTTNETTFTNAVTSKGGGAAHTHGNTFAFSGSSTDTLSPVFGTYFIIKI